MNSLRSLQALSLLLFLLAGSSSRAPLAHLPSVASDLSAASGADHLELNEPLAKSRLVAIGGGDSSSVFGWLFFQFVSFDRSSRVFRRRFSLTLSDLYAAVTPPATISLCSHPTTLPPPSATTVASVADDRQPPTRRSALRRPSRTEFLSGG